MAQREVKHLSPASDNVQDLGQPANRWKNVYAACVSDGSRVLPVGELATTADVQVAAADRDGLMPSGMYSFLSGKGAVTRELVLYIRANGNDANAGLSAATALATPAGAVGLLNTKYQGFIKTCTLDFGAGTFVQNWNLFAIQCFIDTLQIVGAGVDGTVISSASPWVGTGSFSNITCRNLVLSDFTFKRRWEGTDASITPRGQAQATLNNIGFDHTAISTSGPAFTPGMGVEYVYWSNSGKFSGKFSNIINASYCDITLAANCQFTFSAGTEIGYLLSGSTVNFAIRALATLPPVYNGAVATGFANLSYGARVLFANAAAQTAWLNGWNSSVSANSLLGLS